MSLHSSFGCVNIVWRRAQNAPAVQRIFLPNERDASETLAQTAFPTATRGSDPAIDDLCARVSAFLAGAAVTFDLRLTALDICSEFQQRVLLAEYDIPRGWVSTYGRIAAHLGIPGAARAVGTALARNPFPIVIPCHRAIRSNGDLGSYQGGAKMKRALLAYEGVQVSAQGKVLAPGVYY